MVAVSGLCLGILASTLASRPWHARQAKPASRQPATACSGRPMCYGTVLPMRRCDSTTDGFVVLEKVTDSVVMELPLDNNKFGCVVAVKGKAWRLWNVVLASQPPSPNAGASNVLTVCPW